MPALRPTLVSALVAALLGVLPSGVSADEGSPAEKKSLTIQIPPPAGRTLSGVRNPPLRDVRFSFGGAVQLDRRFDPATQAAEGCIDKPAFAARFCMDPVNWPAPLMAALELADDDTIYRGGRAVLRYDENQVSQAHVIFPTSAFIDLIEHLTALYGPPTEQEITVKPVPGDVEVANTIVRWKSLPGKAKGVGGKVLKPAVLEVRAYDDLRHVSPDRQHGFLWLYREGAEPVFRHFTTIDMMVLRQRRVGQWPPEEDAGD